MKLHQEALHNAILELQEKKARKGVANYDPIFMQQLLESATENELNKLSMKTRGRGLRSSQNPLESTQRKGKRKIGGKK